MSDQDPKVEAELANFRILDDARHPIDRAALHRLLDDLLDLREQTDPVRSNNPDLIRWREVAGKDLAARCTVGVAGVLVKTVAGWAINHLIGRALPDAENRPANSHENEIVGAEEYNSQNVRKRSADQAALDRKIIQEILDWYSPKSILPGWLAVELGQSLGALNFGEVWPLLKPANRGLHGKNPLQILWYKWFAIMYANFLVGKGMKKYLAEERVSSEFGISLATLRSWASRDLPTHYGNKAIADELSEAHAAGQLAAFRESHPTPAAPRRVDGVIFSLCNKLCGSDLHQIATEYRELLRGELKMPERMERGPWRRSDAK